MSIVRDDPSSDMPPYAQVRTQIAGPSPQACSAAGKLPTVRALAAELGLAVNTVDAGVPGSWENRRHHRHRRCRRRHVRPQR
jgi:hypothetical protein